VQRVVSTKCQLIARCSDVPARAWPESPGFGLALGGLGLRKLRAGPKAKTPAWLGLALAQAGAFGVCVQFRTF
jgi:hypothetical protein